MQTSISGHNVFGYPGAGAFLARLGARTHDLFKCAIEADLPWAVRQNALLNFFELLAQAVGFGKFFRKQHHALVGAPPQKKQTNRKPREIAMPVRLQYTPWR